MTVGISAMMILIIAIAAATFVSVASAVRGNATLYKAPYVSSSCYGYQNNGVLIGAANDALWNDKAACGKKFSVKCAVFTLHGVRQQYCRNGSVVVEIVGYCPPGCRSTFNLSQEAFARIADPKAGTIEIEYNETTFAPGPSLDVEIPINGGFGAVPPSPDSAPGPSLVAESPSNGGFGEIAPSPDFPPCFKELIKGLVVGLTTGASVLILGQGFIWFISRRKKQKADKLDDDISDMFFSSEFQNGMTARKFSWPEIAEVTSDFKGEKLGEGGFGVVFKGYSRDLDTHVAVKRISKASKQGIKEYASEVKIISRLRHKNLVKLIGWCHEKGELILVYEFMTNGSLDSHLFKGKSLLTWDVRFKIVQGLASALFYLHEEGDHCVLHRDIKTSNIMLDSTFNAKLGDFGLARLVDHAKGSQTTHLAGTMGYMAPECVSLGKASKESDVYSFGVVALEIACGRRSIESEYDESQASLVAWVWDSYGNQRLLDVVDPRLCLDFDAKQMEGLLMVGLWCVHPDQNLRPSIRQAIQVLNSDAPLPKLPGKRPTLTYDIPITSGSEIKASEPCFSSLTIIVPR